MGEHLKTNFQITSRVFLLKPHQQSPEVLLFFLLSDLEQVWYSPESDLVVSMPTSGKFVGAVRQFVFLGQGPAGSDRGQPLELVLL